MRYTFPSTAKTRRLSFDRLWSGPHLGAELDGLTRTEIPLIDPG